MNAILINPIVMASAAASILGAMMCLALYVVKCTIDERNALHVQEYDALYDKCIQLRQKVNTMAAEMSQMRLDANEQTAEIEKQVVFANEDEEETEESLKQKLQLLRNNNKETARILREKMRSLKEKLRTIIIAQKAAGTA